MTELRKTFIVYGEWMQFFDDISEPELARLLRAVFAYAIYGTEPEFTGAMRPIFRMMKNCIDRDSGKYAEKCRRLSENARKGGIAKAEKAKRSLANAENDLPVLHDNVNENDNDNENENDNESVNVNDNGGSAAPAPALGRYGNVCLSENDRKNLCSEYGEETVSKAVEEISEYCASSGKSYKNWSAAIRRWIKRDAKTAAPAAGPKPRPFYHPSDAPSYDLDEWMKTALSLPELWKETE